MPKKITLASMTAAIAGPSTAETAGPVPGLYLRGRHGSGAWIWRRLVGGRRGRIPLGPFPGVMLDEAIARAGDLNAAVAAGRDPAAEAAKTKAKAMTVREAIARYDSEVGKHLRTRVEMRRVLLRFFAEHLDAKTTAVTHADIGRAFNILRGRSPSSARLSVATARPFWAWLHVEGGSAFTIAIDLKAVTPAPRDRVPSVAEVARIYLAAEAEPWPTRQIVELLVLTGLRRSEIAGLRRSEINMAEGMLTIGKARMKAGRPHVVPLAPAALQAVGAALGASSGDLVLAEGEEPFSGWTRLKDRLMARAGVEGATFHDLRRSLQSEGPAKAGISPLVIDLMLAHAPGQMSAASKHYFHETLVGQRREAAVAWADLVLAEVERQRVTATPKLVAVVG